jgi:acyl CoA:acetate/3-ketoacid CoA transferase alpha subunit
LNKVVSSVEEAIKDVEDGASIAVPGFFVAGMYQELYFRGLSPKEPRI